MEPQKKKNCILITTIIIAVLILFGIAVTVIWEDKDIEYEREMFTNPDPDNFKEHMRMFPTTSTPNSISSTSTKSTTSTARSTTIKKVTIFDKGPNTPWIYQTSPSTTPTSTSKTTTIAEVYTNFLIK